MTTQKMICCNWLLVLAAVSVSGQPVATAAEVMPRRATAWIWQCSTNETQWLDLARFANNTAAVDTVSLGAFSVSDTNFTLVDNYNCGQLMREYIPWFQAHAPSVKHTPLIDSGTHGVANLRAMWNTTETRKAFITSAVNTMMKMGLDGYNLDWEVQGTPQDRDNFVRFLHEFGVALRFAKPGATLSSDVAGSLLYGNCTNSGDYLEMTCENYTAGGVDNVISMGTYTHEADSFCATIERGSPFAPMYTPGIALDTPDVNATKFFDCLGHSSINRIYLWALGFNKPPALSPAWSDALDKWASPGLLVDQSLFV